MVKGRGGVYTKDGRATYPDGEEQRLRLVIEAAPNAMVMVDGRGAIVLVNSQTEKLFGYSRSELLGSPVEILIPEQARRQHVTCRNNFLDRPDARSMGAGRDLHGRRKDGSEVPLEIGLNPLQMPEGNCVLASIIDITERKRSEDRLRLIIEAAPNAMIMVNEKGLIVLVNTQAEKLFGYTRCEMLGDSIEKLIPKRFHGQHIKYRKDFFVHPDARSMGAGRDLYGLRKDGVEVPIEIGLNPLEAEEGHFVLASVIDITERLTADKLLRATQTDNLRQSIINSLPFSTIAVDADGLMMAANPAAERLLGYKRHELVGRPVLILHDVTELELRETELSRENELIIHRGFQMIVSARSHGGENEREWTYIRKDGRRLPVNVAIAPLLEEKGKKNGFLIVAYDITERKRAEAYIRHMAHHDALTGLPNRHLLLERLDLAIRQARRHRTRLAILMIDLDQFKRVNDSLGHHIGDDLLLAVSRRLQGCIRKSDTVARLGGDEFVVLLSDVAIRDQLQPVLDELTRAISAPMRLDGHEIVVTPSVGGCLYPHDGGDSNTLLKNADTAMYQAKAAGRNGFLWFTPAMRLQTEKKLAMGAALRHAVEKNQLIVRYQPEISLKSGEVIGIEALVRWKKPRTGVVLPDRFVPIAEETGLIVKLGEWVLRTACYECGELNRSLQRELMLAVNVSPRQFQQKGWVQAVKRALHDSQLSPLCLELEITESMLMQNPKESVKILGSLRNLGVGVVIDDFGTGYSSLSYLTRFPIDKIKIDRSFVRDLHTDSADAAVINAIIAMALSLDIRVVAEGVETEKQHQYIQERGCDQAQGFLYSHAVSIEELHTAISKIELSQIGQ